MEAAALAGGAGDEDIREELHGNLLVAHAPAALTAATPGVKGESGGGEAGALGLFGGGKEFADGVVDVEIEEGGGAGGLAERGLVDQDHIGDLLEALDGFQLGRFLHGAAQMLEQGLVDDFVDEGAFARTAHAGNRHQAAEREGKIQVPQVVAGGPTDFEPRMVFSGARSAIFRKGNGFPAGEIRPGGGLLNLGKAGGRAGIEEAATLRAGTGAELENIFRGADDGLIVFNHEDGVAGLAEFAEKAEQAVGVAGMESDAGFIEDEEGSGEASAQATREVDPLKFSSGEGAGSAVECQVAQAHAEKKAKTFPDVFQRGLGGFVPSFDLREEFGEFTQG